MVAVSLKKNFFQAEDGIRDRSPSRGLGDVYKRQEIASALASGASMDSIEGATKFSGGEKGIAINAILLDPTPLTRDNLSVAINGGHISKEQACAGALPGVDGCN